MIQHLGIASIIVMWAGTIGLLASHHPDRQKSISQHAAKNSRYHVIYGVFEIAVVAAFTLFMFSWFIPELNLGRVSSIAAVIGLIGMIIAAIVPDRKGKKNKIHGLGAYSMAMSMLIINIVLFNDPNVGLVTKTVLAVCISYMMFGWFVAVINQQFYRNRILHFQIVYFLAFHIPIILATYSV